MTNNKLCGLLGLSTRAGKTVFGTESCQSAIEKRRVKLILVGVDASERMKLNFRKSCEKYKIPICEALTVEEISTAIGKNNKAVVGITDINFSKEILKINNGGEVIG